MELDSKTVFSTLSDGLKDAYKELLDVGLKVSGATLIVLGWFASQKNPLAFLCESKALVSLALVLVTVGFGIVCFILVEIYRRAAVAYDELVARGYERTLFARYQVTKAMLAGGIVGEALTLGGIFWYILYKYGLTSHACAVLSGDA